MKIQRFTDFVNESKKIDWKLVMNISKAWKALDDIDITDNEAFSKAKETIISKVKSYHDDVKKLGEDAETGFKAILGKLAESEDAKSFKDHLNKLYDWADKHLVHIKINETAEFIDDEKVELSPEASKFISDKIAFLRKEGRPEAQAQAMAYSYAKRKGFKIPNKKK